MSSRPRRGREGCLHVDVIERIDGRRFGIVLLGPNHTVVDRLLLLLEQILEDELGPSAAACLHQRATLVELSQLDGCEPELFGQGRHGSGRVLVVARQKDDPVPPSTIGSAARVAATR